LTEITQGRAESRRGSGALSKGPKTPDCRARSGRNALDTEIDDLERFTAAARAASRTLRMMPGGDMEPVGLRSALVRLAHDPDVNESDAVPGPGEPAEVLRQATTDLVTEYFAGSDETAAALDEKATLAVDKVERLLAAVRGDAVRTGLGGDALRNLERAQRHASRQTKRCAPALLGRQAAAAGWVR